MSDTKTKEKEGCGASPSEKKDEKGQSSKFDTMIAHAKEFLEASPEEHKKWLKNTFNKFFSTAARADQSTKNVVRLRVDVEYENMEKNSSSTCEGNIRG